MLILSRRVTEAIVIGGDIRITICDVRGGRVSVGIEAPAETPIHRGEVQRLLDEIDDAKRRDQEVVE